MAIDFACPKCSKRFHLKEELAGRVAKCACGSKLRIPQPTSAVSSSSAKVSAVSETAKSNPSDSSWLDEDLGNLEAGKIVKLPAKEFCPTCDVGLTDGAVVCVACGYDLRSGEQHVLQHGDELEPKQKKKGIFAWTNILKK